jgi:hypothetical protein
VLLLGIVAVVGRAEQVRPPRLTRPGPATAAAAAGAVVLIGIGFIDLAGSTALALLEPGERLGPFTASTALGLVLLTLGAGVLAVLRRVAPAGAAAAPGRRALSRPG